MTGAPIRGTLLFRVSSNEDCDLQTHFDRVLLVLDLFRRDLIPCGADTGKHHYGGVYVVLHDRGKWETAAIACHFTTRLRAPVKPHPEPSL
jgi:hypothetical protein